MRELAGSRLVPFTHFALLAQEYMTRHGVSADQIGMVAVKNNRNGGKQSVRTAPKGQNPGGSDGRAGYFGVADAASMLPHRGGRSRCDSRLRRCDRATRHR